MSMPTCQWRRSSAFIVNCKHTSNFAHTLSLVHIEKTNISEDMIRHIMRYVLL